MKNMEESVLTLGITPNYTNYDSTETLISELDSTSYTIMKELRHNLGHRLRKRKEVLRQRQLIVDVSFALALIGVLFVVIDTELIFAHVTTTNSVLSTTLRSMTSVSTVGLLICIVGYHVVGIQLFMASAGFSNWRLAMSSAKWLKLILELCICAVHPLPFLDIPIATVVVISDENSSVLKDAILPINGILTILMSLRLYLLGRFIVVHSKLFLDTSVQSLGALSRVRINAQFVFKAVMSTTPGVVLLCIMFGTFFINSWNLRVCEVYSDPDTSLASYPQALWLTAVTFLTVGYGDLIPRSYCGRMIVGFTALMGVGIMALSVAVLAKNLEQTRSEKYVYSFVQQISLDKKRKHAASDVIKQVIRIWRQRRAGASDTDHKIITYRSKLIRSIRVMNEQKFLKLHLQEVTVGPVELATSLNDTRVVVGTIQDDQKLMSQRISNLETLTMDVSSTLRELKEVITKKKFF